MVNQKKECRKRNAEKINEGAESVIYSATFLGTDSIIKDRIAKQYREKALDKLLRYQRTKKEAKILSIASSIINAPKLLFIEKYRIFIEKLNGKNLNKILEFVENSNKNSSQNNRLKNSINLNAVFKKIGKSIAILHNNNIVHGDFTPANIIVNNNEVFVIDFGLSDISSMIEDKAIDILLMKRAIDADYYNIFINSYKQNANDALFIIKRLEKIEKRGRYQERTLININ